MAVPTICYFLNSNLSINTYGGWSHTQKVDIYSTTLLFVLSLCSVLVWLSMIESVEKGFTDIEAFNYLPKPLYDLVIHTIAVLILRVFSPVIHIDISQATHKKLHSKKCQTVDKKNYGHKNPV